MATMVSSEGDLLESLPLVFFLKYNIYHFTSDQLTYTPLEDMKLITTIRKWRCQPYITENATKQSVFDFIFLSIFILCKLNFVEYIKQKTFNNFKTYSWQKHTFAMLWPCAYQGVFFPKSQMSKTYPY